LHPETRAVCDRFLAKLRGLGVPKASLLVVPRWHGRLPCSDDPEFVEWLRQRAAEGHDICMHGFFHRADHVQGGPIRQFVGRCYTNSEGEFYQIGRDTARDRVQRGLHILVDAAGLPVHGFTPPAWLMSKEGREAVMEAGLHYTTTWSRVELLRARRAIPAPTLVYSCRNAWRRAVSRAWVRLWAWANAGAPVLRIAAHPGDFADPKVEASLLGHVRRALAAGRLPATYRDLLPPGALPIARSPLAPP
jgi:hypothetical protein